MKTKRCLLAVLLCAFLASTGCVTLPNGTIDPKTIQKSAIVLKTATASAVVIALDKDKKNARKYADLAKTILDSLLVETNSTYSPAVLQAKMSALPIKELQSPEAKVAIFSALGLYEAFYGDYVRNRIAGKQNAVLFITAMRDGVKMALDASPVP